MAKLGICDINNLKLSEKSRRSVADIKDIMESGDLLSGVLAATPFYYIFGTPSVTTSPFETLINIREHDWETFGKAMFASSKYTRGVIFQIAYEQEIYTYGEERKFWNCVSELSK
ncbi:hypothetical protein [uncultured Photobacterium sp.]|uniref:hypothetical protein n=1 Tax=uncultured Photobacterium sp. TaxID=173973 RepID=UPI00261E8698|nr:hypothetical protein [uncultured Photobacterium sp.]